MNDIKQRKNAGETGMILIVPEQYSHEAERQLCAVCGDGLSLHAEVLSFTRLCNHVFAETGGVSTRILDKSGQILVMHRALETVAPNLRVYGTKKTRASMTESLLEAVREFKSRSITSVKLEALVSRVSGPLADKLYDLALIYDAYNALLQTHGNDSAERLSLLAEYIGDSSVGDIGHIYFDGFNDFTAQELNIIKELLNKDADITVCLTCDLDDKSEVFELPRRTVLELQRLAAGQGDFSADLTQTMTRGDDSAMIQAFRAPELKFLEKNLFDITSPKYGKECDSISIYAAPTRYVECEYAAFIVWELARSGYRWRDIAVMARDWGEYDSICEGVFEKYGIPYFSSGKTDILGKPPIALIDAALDIAISGWEYKSVFRYLKTGLLSITANESAILENYVLKWQIRGSLWLREWTMPPSGYGRSKEGDEEVLKQINRLRREIIKPVTKLRDEIKVSSNVEIKLRALYEFMTEISLAELVSKESKEFRRRNEKRLADEYAQLWDVLITAMEQMYRVLGDKEISAVDFRKLLTLILAQYDVGVIPISLDRTVLGGMAMNRRRDMKCLILLGATDENLPKLTKSSGALSDNERAQLSKLTSEIPAGLDERLYREMNMIYSVLTMPNKKLIMIYTEAEGQRPSFLVKRVQSIFDISEQTLTEKEYKSAAEAPYYEYVLIKEQTYTQALRNRLSKQAAQRLYGNDMSLSATRVDRYYSCPLKHFLQSGLKLEPRTKAEFDASSAGIFVHYVLDAVFNEVKNGIGFKNTNEKICRELTERYTTRFIKEVLLNFEGKNERFKYLFKRFEADVHQIVWDSLDELRGSEFVPLDLELNMSELSTTHRGYIDRVDGYFCGEKLYLRVIDYKTRKKAYSFDLMDVLQGRDMQMLIYLFALEKHAGERYQNYSSCENISQNDSNSLSSPEIVPAGVLYVPARDVILSASKDTESMEIEKLRRKQMRRSGLIINDRAILDAMESGEDKKYLPVKTARDGELSGDSLVTRAQITILTKHVDRMLIDAKDKILSGDNVCKPYYKNAGDNACTYCDYLSVCGFDEELGDRHHYTGKKTSKEIWEELE
jgi:ATP-dependent helicase/nuclease subunit B